MLFRSDPTCPEDGGPFATKPNLFTSARAWDDHPERDGFRFDGAALLWRRGTELLRWEADTLTTATGAITFSDGTPSNPVGTGRVALADLALLRHLSTGLRTAWSP